MTFTGFCSPSTSPPGLNEATLREEADVEKDASEKEGEGAKGDPGKRRFGESSADLHAQLSRTHGTREIILGGRKGKTSVFQCLGRVLRLVNVEVFFCFFFSEDPIFIFSLSSLPSRLAGIVMKMFWSVPPGSLVVRTAS